MEGTRFRRPVRAGCEWLQAGWGGLGVPHRGDVGLGGPDLSTAAHVRLAALLLMRLARHTPTAHDPIVLHRAIRHIQSALEEQPNDAQLYRALFTAYMLAGDLERGGRAAEVCKTCAPRLEQDVEVDLLRLALENGTHERLAPRYELLVSFPPMCERVAACAGAYLRVSGRLDDACARLAVAHERWPNSVLVHLELATTLWQSADSTASLYHFSQMHDAHPGQPFAQWNLIAALALTGNHDAARMKLEASTSSVASDVQLLALLAPQPEPVRPDVAAPLSGDLSTVSLADILHLLWNCRSFGTLSIDSSWGKGGLVFWKGKLVGAVPPSGVLDGGSTGHGGGRAAVYQQVRTALDEMLSWSSGRFEFRALGETSFPETADEVALDTPVVLLEAYADLDERRR